MVNVIALDVGGTKIFAGRYDTDLNCLDSIKIPTEADKDQATILSNLVTAIEAVRDQETIAIGIAWAGFVNGETGQILKSPNIEALNQFELTAYITEKTGLPCSLENDARCFTLGEYQAAPVTPKVCLGLILGTGVGAGLVINGQVFRGANASASEVGHMMLNDQEIEKQIAGPALNAYFGSENLSDLTKITPAKLEPRLEVLTTWLQSLLLAYDPDYIIIGGGAGIHFWSQFKDQTLSKLNKKIEQYPMSFDLHFSDRLNAGAEGAALLAWQNNEN